MRHPVFLAVCFVAVAPAEEPKRPDAVRAEVKKLEGTWEGYVVDGRGEKPNQGPVHLRLTITPDKMSAVNLDDGNKDMGNGTFQLDPTRTARELDATGIVLPGKQERMYQGIYKLDGDVLKWCVSPRKGARPTELRTAKGSYLLVLKRKK